ncbi:uncharacterized protein [Procambarus clarkii]|uniref:uncharacterized protein n=1 Tax=Procambarus clarkii TaxID=6728 RepID=UPI0037428617
MVCLPFKPAAGTNVPANIRVVDEAHTKMLWKVLATKSCRKILADLHFAECGLESPEVPLSVAETESGESDYDAWTGAPLLCKSG